ncbi:MAG TPA: TlpA disulfide reductase family protein [Methylovirgula sp.]|nr:TlpA disulfide reductase family protein [Methylovirgula sp.]
MPEQRKALILSPLISIAVLAAVLAFIYVMKGEHRNQAAAACPSTRAVIGRLAPLVHGEIAALSLSSDPKPLPDLTFADAQGKMVKLKDFRGRDLLLNLWATWCIPCRQEMPALDRLEGLRGGPDFQVVAINIDTARLDRPKAFLHEIGVKNLAFYADKSADVFETLKEDGKVVGLPTTILVGKDGCDIGTMAGPAQWDSQDALALFSMEQRAELQQSKS